VDHVLEVGFDVPLQPLVRVHDLDREDILRFLRAADRLAVSGHDRDGLEVRRHPFRWIANLANERAARTREADARQIGTEPAAGAGHAMARRALLREQAAAVLDVADRVLGRRGGAQVSQIRDDLQDVVVRRSVPLRRHLGAGHAFANRVEQPLVGHAGGEDRVEIRSAIAARVETVTVATADAIQRHARADRVPVSEMWIAGRGMPGGRFLSCEESARQHASNRQRRQPRQRHTASLEQAGCARFQDVSGWFRSRLMLA
jgi:hypothetical protein